MYSIIAFVMAFIQMAAALGGYAADSAIIFNNVVVFGAPFYLLMTIFTSFSAIIDSNPVYLLFIVWHIVKYSCFFMAQIKDGGGGMFYGAVVLEALYLLLSAYYVY